MIYWFLMKHWIYFYHSLIYSSLRYYNWASKSNKLIIVENWTRYCIWLTDNFPSNFSAHPYENLIWFTFQNCNSMLSLQSAMYIQRLLKIFQIDKELQDLTPEHNSPLSSLFSDPDKMKIWLVFVDASEKDQHEM